MGFGQPLDAKPMLADAGRAHVRVGRDDPAPRRGARPQLDRIAEVHERQPATKRLDIQGHVVEPGTTAALRFEVRGSSAASRCSSSST